MTLPRAYEDQLVERAKRDADAFGELYDHYVSQMYRYIYSRVRDPQVAEDVTSEVFIKALRAISRYQPAGHPFSAWLYQISSNAITDHYRSHKAEDDLDSAIGISDGAVPIDEHVAAKEESARIWNEIDRLPAPQRTAMTLKFGEDLKLAQIAVIMGKSEGAVKLLVHRGTTTLRARLSVSGSEEELQGAMS